MPGRWRMDVVAVVTVTLLLVSGSAWTPRAVLAQTGPFATGSLDQMLAPIALYPDQLLAQILMSAGTPAKITELDQWLKANQKLKGTALQDAAVKAGFEPSLVALVLFPQVVATMAKEITWTTRLGEAFTTDRTAVFASIQKLRKQAKDVGTLKSSDQQDVETQKTSSGQEVIVIEPANPQVIYVPQYNTTTVYTQPPTTTTVVVEQDNDAGAAVAAGLIGFTAGIAIGAAMDNNYYYGPYGWGGRAYMYNDAWDDYYDHREDAREDWMDHREDLADERTDRLENSSEQRTERAGNAQEQRTGRQETRTENRPDSQTQRTERAQGTTGTTQRETARADTTQSQRSRTGSTEARGYSDSSRTQTTQRSSSGRSDAFAGYSSGKSERSASARGQSSRSSARSSGGGGGGRSRRR